MTKEQAEQLITVLAEIRDALQQIAERSLMQSSYTYPTYTYNAGLVEEPKCNCPKHQESCYGTAGWVCPVHGQQFGYR